MVPTVIAAQMKTAAQSIRLRVWVILCGFFTLTVWMVSGVKEPVPMIELLAWTMFLMSILVGGSLTGWRVTQFPKSRAAEFYLVTPVEDWKIILGEILSGVLRTGFVILLNAPILFAMYGSQWINGLQLFTLLTVPLLCGWFAGIALAVVAYEPMSVRAWIEKFVLIAIMLYFILFGLMLEIIVPWLIEFWFSTFQSVDDITNPISIIRFSNPFMLLGSIGTLDDQELITRISWTVGILLFLIVAGVIRLIFRLRKHYYEENYTVQTPRRAFIKKVKTNPLSWWTERRVSRFRGRVNIYLGWAVIALYSIWLAVNTLEPGLLENRLMLFFHHQIGGAAMLGVAAIQFAMVPVAFLGGLWDSNPQLRAGRLELLLVTPLTPKEFMQASVRAGWTRGKSLIVAALVVWSIGLFAGTMTWFGYLIGIYACFAYMLIYFAVSFRNFARVDGDRPAALWGLGISVGIPLFSWAFFAMKQPWIAACTPLGGMYLATSKEAFTKYATGHEVLMILAILFSSSFYLIAGWFILKRTLQTFDKDIREWFLNQLATGGTRKRTKEESNKEVSEEATHEGLQTM